MEKMNYTGQDLIFATGAPGSKWSRILALIGLHPSINNSDKDNLPRYNMDVTFPSGRVVKVGNHSGAYFGPYNKIGENFEDLTALSKEEFVEEIKKPFDNWETGIKIIKSHWFSYKNNLNWLRENFPDAKIILSYNGNEVAFKWWHFVGGWNIDFPIYTWYNNDSRMYEKILEENAGLLSFAKENLIPIQFYSSVPNILLELGLSNDLDFLNYIDNNDIDIVVKGIANPRDVVDVYTNAGKGCALGILTNTYTPCTDITDFNNKLLQANATAIDRHNEIKVEELLKQRHGREWLEQINFIVQASKNSTK